MSRQTKRMQPIELDQLNDIEWTEFWQQRQLTLFDIDKAKPEPSGRLATRSGV